MIALTGHADPRDVEAGRDAGFTDYVAKFEREALLASLQQCLAEMASAEQQAASPERGPGASATGTRRTPASTDERTRA